MSCLPRRSNNQLQQESAQKTREIFFFPAARAAVTRELALTSIEFLGVDATPATADGFVRNDGVQHLMIENVFEKPNRDEGLIEQGIDSNDAILFLDGAENKIFLGPLFAPASPHHFVTAKAAAKISFVQVIENRAQIEIAAFMLER